MLNYLWSPTVCSCFAENKAQWLSVSCWEPFSGCCPEGSHTTYVPWESGSAFISAFRSSLHKISQPSSCKMFFFSLYIHQDVPKLPVLYQEMWKFEFWGRIHDNSILQVILPPLPNIHPFCHSKAFTTLAMLTNTACLVPSASELALFSSSKLPLHVPPTADHMVRAIQQQVSLGLLYHCSMTDFRVRMAKFRKVVFLSHL